MAFPTIPTVAAGRVLFANDTGTASPQTRTFPAFSGLTYNDGDLLLAIVTTYQSTTNPQFSSWSNGFTEISDQGSSTTMGVGVAYKIASGTESGSLTVSQAGTVTGHASLCLMAIPGAHTSTAPEVLSPKADATTAQPDPASFDPANWGTEDTLWIAVYCSGMTSGTGTWIATGTTTPTNYTNWADSNTADNSTVGQTEIAVTFRQVNAASEDAGVAGVDTSNARSSAFVIAVRPTSEVSVALTTVNATGNITAPSVSVNGALSTVNATGQVGTLTPTIETSVAITTVSATSEVGTLTPSLATTVPITTVSAAGQVGDIGKTLSIQLLAGDGGAAAVALVPGAGFVEQSHQAVELVPGAGFVVDDYSAGAGGNPVSATGQTGTIGAGVETAVALTTVSATGATGSLGKTLDRALTTVSATGQAGNLGTTLDVAISTVSTTGQTGTLTPSQATTVALTTVSSTGATGLLGKTHTVALTTVAATGQVGTLTPSLATIADLSGVSATGQTGSLGKTLDRAVTTVAGTGQTGTLTPSVSTTVALTSASATGAVGSVTPSKSGETFTIALSGNLLIGYLGTISTSGGQEASPSRYYGGGKDVDADIVQKQWEILDIRRRAARAAEQRESRQEQPRLSIAPPQAAAEMAEPALMSDEEIIKLVLALDALE